MKQLADLSAPSYINFHSLTDIPLHFLGLELLVYTCFVLTLRHALKHHREGDSFHLFQWMVLFMYGIGMELFSFNFFQNYEHGKFSVQFYHDQLPMYITCIYLVFHYTGIKVVERLNLPLLAYGLLSGFAIALIDVPFDSLGVDAGWWVWADNTNTALHPRFIEAVKTRWFGVPVTSYYWYMMYGALLAILSRVVHQKIAQKSLTKQLFAALLVSVSVMVLGALAFEVMFWLPRYVGLSDHLIVAGYFAAMLLFALTIRAPNAEKAEAWLLFIPFSLYGFHLLLLAWLLFQGKLSSPMGKGIFIPCAAIAMFILLRLAPLRKAKKPGESSKTS